jgi:hypothetical protein
MCTLSYIPLTGNSFLLTSNRDESVSRLPALPPMAYHLNGVSVVYPKDTQAGGTWLAVSENQFTLCLLNGAFVKHKHSPPYKHSRGRVVTDFYQYNSVRLFINEYDFTGIEPFSLVILETRIGKRMHEIRWDGDMVYYVTLNPSIPHIWSSATLYDVAVIQEREKWFFHFLTKFPLPTASNMLHFHHFGGGQNEQNSLLMNRNNTLKTISITCIQHIGQNATILHENLLTGEKTDTTVPFLNIQ